MSTHINDQVQRQREKPLQRVWQGIVATDAVDDLDRVSVVIPGLDRNLRWEEARWQSKGGLAALPKRGNECAIVIDDDGELWIAAWWPDTRDPTVSIMPWSGSGAGPPTSPKDKDIWIATNIAGQGVRWQFQYDATWATDAYKWKFIGGASIRADVDTSESTSSAAPVDLATVQSLTFVRAGLYDFDWGCQCYHDATVNASMVMTITKAGVGQMDVAESGNAINSQSSIGRRRSLAVAAADVLKAQYSTNGGANAHFLARFFVAQPVRII